MESACFIYIDLIGKYEKKVNRQAVDTDRRFLTHRWADMSKPGRRFAGTFPYGMVGFTFTVIDSTLNRGEKLN